VLVELCLPSANHSAIVLARLATPSHALFAAPFCRNKNSHYENEVGITQTAAEEDALFLFKHFTKRSNIVLVQAFYEAVQYFFAQIINQLFI
jgi:hypothetical protein